MTPAPPILDRATLADPVVLAAHSARLYHRYARAVDEGDLDTLRLLATDGVAVTRGEHPTEWGVEAFLDVFRAHVAQRIPVCRHVVTNLLADWDGDVVRTHAYFQATMLESAHTRVVTGSYRDDHVLDGGQLLMAHKRIQVVGVVHLPPAAAFAHVGADPST